MSPVSISIASNSIPDSTRQVNELHDVECVRLSDSQPSEKVVQMESILKRCSLCQTTLRDWDEVYVCSACGTSHHSDCWVENGSCTTYGCSGKPRKRESLSLLAEIDDSAPLFIECPSCQYKMMKDSRLCMACGYSALDSSQKVIESGDESQASGKITLDSVVQQREIRSDLNSEFSGVALYAVYFKHKSPYYLGKFKEVTSGRSPWNHAAFWFGPIWMFYRKLYGIGILLLAASVLGNLVLPGATSIGIAILCGINANTWYKSYLDKKIMIFSQEKESVEAAIHEEEDTNGGLVAGLIAIVIFIGIVVLVSNNT
jgi:hypothetical protein